LKFYIDKTSLIFINLFLDITKIVTVFKDFNPHLHRCVLKHRDQKYFSEVSFWPPEYWNRPPKVPLIFNSKNFVSEIAHQTGNALCGCNFLFYVVKTALEPDNNLQIYL
jgi:hypothetical protein